MASCPLSWIATTLALGSSRDINLVLCWMLHASTNSYYWARKCHPPTFDVLASPWRNYRWRRILLFYLAVWIRHEYWVLLCCVPQSIWKFLLIMRDWRRDLKESNWKVALQAFFTSWLENIKIIIIVVLTIFQTRAMFIVMTILLVLVSFREGFQMMVSLKSRKLIGDCNFGSGLDNSLFSVPNV